MKNGSIKVLSTLAALVFLLVFIAPAHAFEFGARGYYWFPDFSGDVRVDKNSIIGTTISTEDDLGIGNESYPSVEVFMGAGKHHINFMYTKADYSGEKNLSRSIDFMGKTYTDGSFVQSDLAFKMLDLEYQYDLLDLENILAGFSLGVIGKIKYIDGEARLRATSLGYDESETFQVPIPMIGLGMHVGILADILEARAKIAGIGYSGNKFYEGQADISVTPFPFLDIHGGYKIMKLDVDDVSDVYVDVEFKGPYVGLTLSF
jgi:outer membrane protein